MLQRFPVSLRAGVWLQPYSIGTAVSFRRTWFLILVSTLLLFSCRQQITDNPSPNQPPKTSLWLYPEGPLQTGVSRQHLHWWGEDPDGVVVGYLFAFSIVTTNVTAIPSPDTLRYTWVMKNDTTILFPLDTLFRRFAVVVRGVDNSFGGLPEQSIVRFVPFPYWDKNDNGLYDAGDVQLPSLATAADPKGAVLTFPIRNSPPSVAFIQNPLDPTVTLKQPDTTYTVVSLAWQGSDPDGNNTLASYRIALNDTSGPSNWLTVPLRDTMVTLVVPRSRSDAAGGQVVADVYGGVFLGRHFIGQLSGLLLDAPNVLYVEAKDVAGEYSPAITMPSGSDHWFVRKPRGRLLLVTDYIGSDAAAALSTYLSSLGAVSGAQFQSVDQLDIGLGLRGEGGANDKSLGKAGLLVPSLVDPALINTFLLYDYVLWYTDAYPSLGVAQLSLFTYIQNGGKVLFSTSFLNTIDPRGALRDFAPIDSVSSADLSSLRPPIPPAVAGDSRIPANYILIPDSTYPARIYPQLAFNSSPIIHSIYMRPVYRRSDARYIYHLQADARTPTRYFGSPNLAVVDGQSHIVFVGVPLHILNNTTVGNPRGLAAFLELVFVREFNPLQKVNRARF